MLSDAMKEKFEAMMEELEQKMIDMIWEDTMNNEPNQRKREDINDSKIDELVKMWNERNAE